MLNAAGVMLTSENAVRFAAVPCGLRGFCDTKLINIDEENEKTEYTCQFYYNNEMKEIKSNFSPVIENNPKRIYI